MKKSLPFAGLALLPLMLTLVLPARAQTFTRITNPANPIVTDVSSNYSGATWVDYNDDGRLDLFVNNDFLYRNNGNDQFSRVTTTIGEGISSATGNGNTWGDYDNDGHLDVFICSGFSSLYRGNGDGTFTRVSFGAIAQSLSNRGWACAWGDMDSDGDLDLVVTHPAGFVPSGSTTNHVFINLGPPSYNFIKLAPNSHPINTGFSSYTVGTFSDFDDDGDLDYFIGAGPANGTTQPDFLYTNQRAETGANTYVRVTSPPLGTDPQDGQVWNWIDYDNDGDLDAYLTNWGGNSGGGMVNRLYRHDGAGFTRISQGSIVQDVHVSLSSVWGDYDNDGDQDCLVTGDNGQPDRYYRNNGNGSFTSVANALTFAATHRGASAGDYDNDGDLDLYVDGPAGARALFRNDTANGNHWLKVKLTGSASNRSAIGTKVRVRAVIGGQTVRQLREVSAQNTFNGHNALDPHFGLGDATHVDELSIHWPSGIVERFTNVAADQNLVIGENTAAPPIPDGARVPGQPLLAGRNGDAVDLSWDATACPAVAVNVYSGAIGDFGTVTGGQCGLPGTGVATLDLSGDSWFLVVSTDGASADGSWGFDGDGNERVLSQIPAVCPDAVSHVSSGLCP